jgi:hypothetical protein
MYDGLFPDGTLLTAPSRPSKLVDRGEELVDVDRQAGEARVD